MTVTISMPQLGLTMTEATVGVWLKKPGDTVKKDEPLLSVSTDKVDMDVESIVDGVLREILIEEGQTVPVGTPLAHLDVVGNEPASVDSVCAPRPTPQGGNPAQIDRVHENEEPVEIFRTSPRARRLAKQLGIDIAAVQGSGPQGRVIEKDLQALAASRPSAPSTSQPDKRRQVIAESMTESLRTIPAFSISLEVNAEKLVSLYRDLREPVSRSTGTKLTYTDLLFRALALSLAAKPGLNAIWEGGQIRPRSRIVLGLAVATDRGVVAPVLADVDRLTLIQIVKRRDELAGKARAGRLTFADLEGGVGTLSNLGMYRVDRFEGMITPGQSFILAAGKLCDRPWVEGTALVVRPTVILNLSVDHRVADGAAAAVFLEGIAEVIENPYRVIWDE